MEDLKKDIENLQKVKETELLKEEDCCKEEIIALNQIIKKKRHELIKLYIIKHQK